MGKIGLALFGTVGSRSGIICMAVCLTAINCHVWKNPALLDLEIYPIFLMLYVLIQLTIQTSRKSIMSLSRATGAFTTYFSVGRNTTGRLQAKLSRCGVSRSQGSISIAHYDAGVVPSIPLTFSTKGGSHHSQLLFIHPRHAAKAS